MRNIILTAPLISILFVSFFSAAQVSAGTLADRSTPEAMITKSYISNVISAYACRNVIDGGNAEYHKSMQQAEDALTRTYKSRDAAKAAMEKVRDRIENEDPGAQLQRQFDEVHADDTRRKATCEQLLAGAQKRMADADKALADSLRNQ